MLNEQLHRIAQRSLGEGRKLFWIFIYLWVLLGLFAAHKSIVLNEHDLLFRQGSAFINAWLLAKVIFIAEMFNVADNLKHKPLIYPIVFKSAVFAFILISFYIIEESLLALWRGKTVAESLSALAGGSLTGILVFGIIMCFVLMPFFALRELGRDIGDGKLYELFFKRRNKYIQQQS